MIAPPYKKITTLITGLGIPFRLALNKEQTLLFNVDTFNDKVSVYQYPSGKLLKDPRRRRRCHKSRWCRHLTRRGVLGDEVDSSHSVRRDCSGLLRYQRGASVTGERLDRSDVCRYRRGVRRRRSGAFHRYPRGKRSRIGTFVDQAEPGNHVALSQ